MQHKRIIEQQKADDYEERLKLKKIVEESMTLDGVRKSDLVKQRILAHKQQIAYEYNS